MATIRWYLDRLARLSPDQPQFWQALVTTPVTAATLNGNWTVGTGATFSSEFTPSVARDSTTFVGNTVPDGTLDTSLLDGLATGLLNGTFASGNWTFQFAVVSTVSAGAADGQIVFRMIKADANVANATQITSGQQFASVCTNVGSTDVNGTLTFNPGAFTITNQYLFIQIAWKRTGAGGMTTTNIALRTGSSATVGTTILSSDFTPAGGGGADQGVSGAFVTSTSVVYSPQAVTPGAVTLTGTTLAAGAQLFTGTVSTAAGAQAVTGTTLASSVAVTAGTVAPGAVTTTGATIGSGAQTFSGSVSPGAVTLTGTTLTSGAVLRTGTVTTVTAVSGATLTSMATLTAGSVTTTTAVTGTTLASTLGLFPGTVSLTTGGAIDGAVILNSAALFPGLVTPGAVLVTGASRATSAQVFPGVVAAAAIAVITDEPFAWLM